MPVTPTPPWVPAIDSFWTTNAMPSPDPAPVIWNSKVVLKPPTTLTGWSYHMAPRLFPPVPRVSWTRMTVPSWAARSTRLRFVSEEKSG